MYDEGETAVLTPPDASERTARIDGVVIGTLAGFADGRDAAGRLSRHAPGPCRRGRWRRSGRPTSGPSWR